MLKKIECFIQPLKLEAVRDALLELGIDGMSVLEARGFGRHRGHVEKEPHGPEPKFLPKMKLEIVLDESLVEEAIAVIQRMARTGTIGAGKIFVLPVEDAVRISTQEKGKAAIT